MYHSFHFAAARCKSHPPHQNIGTFIHTCARCYTIISMVLTPLTPQLHNISLGSLCIHNLIFLCHEQITISIRSMSGVGDLKTVYIQHGSNILRSIRHFCVYVVRRSGCHVLPSMALPIFAFFRIVNESEKAWGHFCRLLATHRMSFAAIQPNETYRPDIRTARSNK